MHYLTPYPGTPAERDRFILDLRGPRPRHDPWRFQRIAIDDEITEDGTVARVGTVFLTGRECPWRCAMCDLWRWTTRRLSFCTGMAPAARGPRAARRRAGGRAPRGAPRAGASPSQIEAAQKIWRERDESISRLKLYNASNFFDPRAVP